MATKEPLLDSHPGSEINKLVAPLLKAFAYCGMIMGLIFALLLSLKGSFRDFQSRADIAMPMQEEAVMTPTIEAIGAVEPAARGLFLAAEHTPEELALKGVSMLTEKLVETLDEKSAEFWTNYEAYSVNEGGDEDPLPETGVVEEWGEWCPGMV